MKGIAAAAFAAVLALAITQPPAHAQVQSSLRIGLADDPDVLDPTFARTYAGRIVFAGLCDKLFDIDEKLNVIPQLALSHATSDDGKEVTIKLRPGVKFHNGETMDAEAVKASLDRHLSAQGSFRRAEISSIDRIEIVDPLSVKLVLKSPNAPLLVQLTDRAGMILSPKAIKEMGDKFGQKPVCAGPYRFVERVQQNHITLERFADYWNKDNVHIDRVVYVTMIDSAVRLANLKSGQLQLIERMQATDIKEVRANKALALKTATELGYQGLWINVGKGDPAKGPLGSDPRIREALEWSLDREVIDQVVFDGEFIPGNQWISPGNPYYQAKWPVPKRDVAKAKELLRQAGVTTPLEIDFMVPTNADLKAVAEIVQGMAAEAGIAMKIRLVEFATSLKEAEDGRYQAMVLGWSGRPDPDGNIYAFAKSKGPLNYGGYSNAEVDQALDDARVKNAVADRKPLYEKVAARLMADRPFLYFYHRTLLVAHTAKLQNMTLLPDGIVRVVGLKLAP